VSVGASWDGAPGWLDEVEDERECFVDGALLGCATPPGEAVEAFDVDGADLGQGYATEASRRH